MPFTTHLSGDTLTLGLHGDLSIDSVNELERELASLQGAGVRQVRVDCAQLGGHGNVRLEPLYA